MNNLQAALIARDFAANSSEKYAADARTNQSWQSHDWVIQAIMFAASLKASEPGETAPMLAEAKPRPEEDSAPQERTPFFAGAAIEPSPTELLERSLDTSEGEAREPVTDQNSAAQKAAAAREPEDDGYSDLKFDPLAPKAD